ncbi:uncharacterized protein PG986_013704 [Apiospora aurea]|uniref:Uncharacterized protein n=1 Tax=Apiospora aurea TaxID=335848 RepID=A0ABR1PWD4_9PEZI
MREYNWAIAAELTPRPADYHYVAVKEAARVAGQTSWSSEPLPSTSYGDTFTVLPPTTTSSSNPSLSAQRKRRGKSSASSSHKATGDATLQSLDTGKADSGLSTGAKGGGGCGGFAWCRLVLPYWDGLPVV